VKIAGYQDCGPAKRVMAWALWVMVLAFALAGLASYIGIIVASSEMAGSGRDFNELVGWIGAVLLTPVVVIILALGLPAPVDAAVMATAFLARPISAVELREATADLLIEFAQGARLEIIPDSAGYESWEMSAPSGRSYVAQGGGQICTWITSPAR
jgi:Family of unknown function (DUF6188)